MFNSNDKPNRVTGTMAINVEKLSDAAGAIVSGLDLTQSLSSDDTHSLKQAWQEHMVLVLRGQELTEEEQERFCKTFGEIAGLRSRNSDSKFLFVTNKDDPKLATAVQLGEMMFHCDQAYAEHPCKASTLYSIEIPDIGGNTSFANCCAAYDQLSDEWKQRLDGKTALNYFNYATNPSMRPDEIDPDAPQHSHPVIRTHPETGRKSIYVNRLMTIRINEVEKEESDEILDYLFNLIESPHNVYEHVWQVNDLVLWDNRCTAHARQHYDPEKRRLLRRMTILDENPVA
jgi:taurine dioxygenase